MTNKVWFCKIGTSQPVELPRGADWPMRQAIQKAFLDITGQYAEFTFSGWGGELTIEEQNVVDNKN